ncbi:MAG: tetratricopeptide repeat protein [Planctomycetota bacterium]|nr:tetratricopeptide repeat protein [Planctomycetota bacterium]
MKRILPLAAGFGYLLVACQGSESAPLSRSDVTLAMPAAEQRSEPQDVDGPPPVSEEERAIAAIQGRDYEGARAILAELLLVDYLAEAEALFDEGRPEDGLPRIDEALELSPRHPGARLLSGRGRLMLAEKMLAQGRDPTFAYEDALTDFQDAFPGAAAFFGASRAARMLGRTDEALRYALAGKEVLVELADTSPEIEAVWLRTLSEATYGAYVEARRETEMDAAAVSALYEETEGALDALMGRAVDDPWVWTTLSYLYEWEGRMADARSTLERGLDRVPDDAGMLERLSTVAIAEGGDANRLAVMSAFRERHPDVAGGWWQESLARFDTLLASFEQESFQPDGFRAAEQGFVRCREIDPARHEACLGYEVMCRNAVGWCLYNQGDVEGAKEAFRSMEDLFPGGMSWRIEGSLPAGVSGLEFVASSYHEAKDWPAGAEVFEILHGYAPDEPKFANNAGFFNREAGVELELEGRRLCRAARGEITDPEALAAVRKTAGIDAGSAGTPAEREAFVRTANESLRRARDHMERSRDAYLDASRLAPDDVRIVNDTALILIYYLHTDLDLAQEMLMRCVRMGEEQLQDETLEEELRLELENAWGDAHENLGVLFANHKGDPEVAVGWFTKSVEIGPEPRTVISNHWLPHLRGESGHEEFLAATSWADPCEAR